MTKTHLWAVAVGAGLLLACSETPTDSTSTGEFESPMSVSTQFDAKGGKPGGGGSVSDPTPSFDLPDVAGAYGLFGDSHGVYEDGICGVETRLFATTDGSGSGDAILDTSGRQRKCSHSPRIVTLSFENVAGGAETEQATVRINVHEVQTPTSFIPILSTEPRGMNLNPWSGSRCENIHFKETLATGDTTGASSVLVTRLAADTWRVQSQPGGRALCADGVGGGELIDLPVDFTIRTSTALPG